MSSGPGLSDAIPNRYAGPQVNLVPIQVFPREPLSTDKKYPIGQVVILGKDPSSGTQGDLWYLAKFAAGVADWRILSASGGSVTDLRDQVNTLVTPTNDGYIDIDGAVVANGANPSGIPLETVGSTNTLTIQQQVASAIAGAPADKNDAGICSFDNTAFSVDANGYVTLTGGAGPAVDSVNVDFNTAPGTDPVVATAGGVISIAGATVASGANASAPVATHSRAANAFNIEVQVGADRTGAPANKFDAGLVSFNDTQFVTDSNGYTSLVGGADLPGIQTLTSDDPTAVGPDGSGNVTCTGEAVANATNAKPLFVDAGANALNWEIQVATEITGAPADKNDAGICSFDDLDFTVDTNGYVSLVEKFTWTEVAINTSMAVNTGYILNDGASHDLLLPSTAVAGDTVKIIRKGAGGCVITQGASQVIHFNTSATTVGAAGTLTSSNQWDAITIVCVTANTTWVVMESSGMWTAA